MAGKAIAFAEALEFGKKYASQVVENAQALAQGLHERGFKVLGEKNGFTKSHTVVIDVAEQGGGKPLSEALEKANVITNKNLLPWDPGNKAQDPSGIRLGSQECTRLGMGSSEMDEIADIIKEICMDKKEPEEVRERVIDLKSDHKEARFCFNDGESAYPYIEMLEDL